MATKNPNEKVTVHIVATERVTYDAEVEMTRADFEKFADEWIEAGVDEEPAERIINKFIDRSENWLNDDNYEVDTFEIVGEDEAEDAE